MVYVSEIIQRVIFKKIRERIMRRCFMARLCNRTSWSRAP